MKVRKAVIPAAGLGTRFLPATKVVPKELLPIVDRPALEYIVEELADSGIEEIILVINSDKRSIIEHFTRGGVVEEALIARGQLARMGKLHGLLDRVKFRTAFQEKAMGLGHAVLSAKSEVGNEPFAVVLPDDLVRAKVPCLQQLLRAYEREKISVVALDEVPADHVSRYGIVSGRGSETRKPFRIETIVEKPKNEEAPSRWAIIGRYVLEPEIFSVLEKTKPGAIGEIQLTDALAVIAKGKGLLGFPFEGVRLDAGQPPGLLQAAVLYALDDPEIAGNLKPFLRTILDGK